jgi:hypothetical protein
MYCATSVPVLAVSCLLFLILIVNLQAIRFVFTGGGVTQKKSYQLVYVPRRITAWFWGAVLCCWLFLKKL